MLDYLATLLEKIKMDSLVSSVVEALEIYVKDTIDTESFLKITPLISHIKMVLGHSNMLSDNARCSIHNQLGRLYYHLRDYGESRDFLEKSLAIKDNNLSHNEEFLITTLKYLALTNMELGDHQKAQEIVERCLGGYKPYFLKERVDVAETLSVMADVYGVIGEYKKAQRLFEKSLEIYKKTAGDDLAPTAFATVLLGNVHSLLGEYRKGHTLLEQGLKIYQNSSQDYFATAATFVLLGNSYLSLGEPEKAKSLIQQGVDIYRSHLSEKHIDLGWALVYLASAFEALGDNNQAKMILQESLEIHSQSLGQDNIRSASVLFHLGRVNLKLGLLQEARELLQTAHKAYEKEYGPDHIETARIYHSFGEAARLEENLEEAEKHLWKALTIFLASNHTDSHMLLEDLAELHKEKSKQAKEKGKIEDFQNNQRQAVKLLEQADKIIKARFSEDSPHIKRVQEKMSNLEY